MQRAIHYIGGSRIYVGFVRFQRVSSTWNALNGFKGISIFERLFRMSIPGKSNFEEDYTCMVLV